MMWHLIIFPQGNMWKYRTGLHTYTRAIIVKGYRSFTESVE